MICLEHVSVQYSQATRPALRGLTLEVADGETLVLLGSSGSGKTTTLKTINRLVEPSEGRVLIGGRDVQEVDPVTLRRRMGYVIQHVGLLPHLNVRDNVTVMLRLAGWSAAARRSHAEGLLELVSLEPSLATRLPDELSGGQQQRVGVARALAAGPGVLLMDEPFGALDAVTREGLQNELRAIKRKLQPTIVFVTHDVVEAFVLADRIAVLHEGQLQQAATPQEVARDPATPYVRALVERRARQLAEVSVKLAGRG